jgi:hypothetical protein
MTYISGCHLVQKIMARNSKEHLPAPAFLLLLVRNSLPFDGGKQANFKLFWPPSGYALRACPVIKGYLVQF